MYLNSRNALKCAVPILVALSALRLFAQTIPLCNGVPATLVVTAPGQITGTAGDDVMGGTPSHDRISGLGGMMPSAASEEMTRSLEVPERTPCSVRKGVTRFFWAAAGDSNDRIEGSSETDTLLMLGNGAPEEFELSANGSRLRLFRNVASVVLDIAGVERIELESRGGSDMITLSSLVGTELQQITLDLEAADNTNTPDDLSDSLFVFGRTLDDQITVAGAGNVLNIAGAGP